MEKPNYTGKTYENLNGDEIGYIVTEDGYDIYLNWSKWIVQHEPYIPDRRKTYEENAIKQIEDMLAAEKENAKNAESKQSQLDGIEQTVSTILANQMGM
jgi:hypothetical protein